MGSGEAELTHKHYERRRRAQSTATLSRAPPGLWQQGRGESERRSLSVRADILGVGLGRLQEMRARPVKRGPWSRRPAFSWVLTPTL